MYYIWSSGPPYFYKQLACGKKLLLCVYRVWFRVSRLPSHLFRIVKCLYIIHVYIIHVFCNV